MAGSLKELLQVCSWDALCDACLPVIGTKPARQTLVKFVRIRNAFLACKKRLKEEYVISVYLRRYGRRVPYRALERENERLKRENRKLLGQFVVWQYNANVRGLSDRELNKALPSIDRGQTN